jgi:hypothetical protein
VLQLCTPVRGQKFQLNSCFYGQFAVRGLLDGGSAKLFAAIFNVTSRATDALHGPISMLRIKAICRLRHKNSGRPKNKKDKSRQQLVLCGASARNLRRAQQQEESGHHGLI